MISPGQAVRVLLQDLGWTLADLAVILDRSELWVDEVCANKESLSVRDALALEAASDGLVDASAWLDIQARWQLAQLKDDASLDASLEAVRARVAARQSGASDLTQVL